MNAQELQGYLVKEGPHPAGMGGEQRLYAFPNGYEVSVVRTPYSHGGEQGFWELAVRNPDGGLDYSTPVTDDTIGWLEWEAVLPLLDQVYGLPTPTAAQQTARHAAPYHMRLSRRRNR